MNPFDILRVHGLYSRGILGYPFRDKQLLEEENERKTERYSEMPP